MPVVFCIYKSLFIVVITSENNNNLYSAQRVSIEPNTNLYSVAALCYYVTNSIGDTKNMSDILLTSIRVGPKINCQKSRLVPEKCT